MTDQEQTPALKLSIGTPLNIHVLSQPSSTRLNGRVLGMLEGNSIIAHLLSPEGALKAGDEVAVRCLEGKSISAFRTKVLETASRPYPHFHLAFPTRLDRVEVRQSERVSVAIPVSVRTTSGATVTGEIRDLSASGALLIAGAGVGEAGEHVTFDLTLMSGQMHRVLPMKASVRNSGMLSQTPGSPARYRCGLQFLELGDPDRLFLLGFVYERLSSNRALFPIEQPG